MLLTPEVVLIHKIVVTRNQFINIFTFRLATERFEVHFKDGIFSFKMPTPLSNN